MIPIPARIPKIIKKQQTKTEKLKINENVIMQLKI
jgi:hypothetical protein